MNTGNVKRKIFNFEARKNWSYPPRQIGEDMEEVEAILSGFGKFKDSNGEWSEISQGSVIWYQPGEIVEAETGSEPYLTCVFRFEKDPAFPAPSRFSSWRNALECADFCARALELFQEGSCDETRWRCIKARLHWEALETERAKEKARLHPALEKALAFIRESFCQKISVKEIAEAAEISVPHLHMLFRERLGESPGRFVNRLRLDRAQSLLLMTSRPVKELCAECGFADPGAFGALFKRRFGVAPLACRRGKD